MTVAQQPADSADASRAYSLAAIPPQQFDKYTLIGKLGHGGMAEVNLAVVDGKGGFRKLVVIKRLHRHLAAEVGFIDMFLDEARLAARLNHPHCIQTHEVGEWDANHFLAMEYLDGQGLERLLRMSGQRDEPIPVEMAARIVSDALDGLAYAHELTDFDGTPLGVVHRDISPQNIFITYTGVVKLLDFGIAKAATHVVETRTGVIKGKYAYIAPEQALAQDVDHRADLWSMGVVFWEVLTGRRLFKSVNELATLHETLQGEIKPPSTFRPDVPRELDAIVMRALTREVNNRYQSAQEMKEELDRFLLSLSHTPGRKEVARLMRDRFGEVIDHHKQTLAQCLKGTALSITTSGIHQIIDPMVTPSGMSPVSHPGAYAGGSGAYFAQPALEGAPMPPKRSGFLWKAALVVLVIAAAGAGALLYPLAQTSTPKPIASGARLPVEPPVAPTKTPTVVPTPPVVPVPPTPPPTVQAPVAPEPVAAHDTDTDTETGARPLTRAERLALRREQRRNATEQPEPQRERTPEATGGERETSSQSEGSGYLTLVTTPWTRVRLGGRDLGTTPLIRVELPAGSHTLHLNNPEQDIDETYRVTIESGQTVVRRLGLR